MSARRPLVGYIQEPWIEYQAPQCGPCKIDLELHLDYLGRCWICPSCMTRWSQAAETDSLGDPYTKLVGPLPEGTPVLDVGDQDDLDRAALIGQVAELDKRLASPYTPAPMRRVLQDQRNRTARRAGL